MITVKKTSELKVGDFARPDWLLIWAVNDEYREIVYHEQDDPERPLVWHTSLMDLTGYCAVVESLNYEKWYVNVDENP